MGGFITYNNNNLNDHIQMKDIQVLRGSDFIISAAATNNNNNIHFNHRIDGDGNIVKRKRDWSKITKEYVSSEAVVDIRYREQPETSFVRHQVGENPVWETMLSDMAANDADVYKMVKTDYESEEWRNWRETFSKKVGTFANELTDKEAKLLMKYFKNDKARDNMSTVFCLAFIMGREIHYDAVLQLWLDQLQSSITPIEKWQPSISLKDKHSLNSEEDFQKIEKEHLDFCRKMLTLFPNKLQNHISLANLAKLSASDVAKEKKSYWDYFFKLEFEDNFAMIGDALDSCVDEEFMVVYGPHRIPKSALQRDFQYEFIKLGYHRPQTEEYFRKLAETELKPVPCSCDQDCLKKKHFFSSLTVAVGGTKKFSKEKTSYDRIPATRNVKGELILDFDKAIYDDEYTFKSLSECGSRCKCTNANCKETRLIKDGISNVELEVFRTPGTDWGVRARQDISKGAFLCLYTGKIATDKEANKLDWTYLFEVDHGNSNAVINAKDWGNISRFINHGCDPNTVAVKVFLDYDNVIPHLAIFALKDIKKGDELRLDYHWVLTGFQEHSLMCFCGSQNCKKFLI